MMVHVEANCIDSVTALLQYAFDKVKLLLVGYETQTRLSWHVRVQWYVQFGTYSTYRAA